MFHNNSQHFPNKYHSHQAHCVSKEKQRIEEGRGGEGRGGEGRGKKTCWKRNMRPNTELL
jgi:hypothetical protein